MLVKACGPVLIVFSVDYQMEDCPQCSAPHFLLLYWMGGRLGKEGGMRQH